MLDEYIDSQKIVYNILKNSVENNHLSHAYLFETNGYINKDEFTLAFVKYLLCSKNYSNNKYCVNCTQCKNIENGSFSEIKHIYPDGMWIKKEQLSELQKEFNKTSIQTDKKVYIIHEAEKLNIQAANSILKFLEEPEKNIIAILMTDNIHQLLDTIISRCQVISFAKNNNTKNLSFEEKIKLNINLPKEIKELTSDEFNIKIGQVINFIVQLEKKKKSTLLYTQKLFHNCFNDKNMLIFALEIMNLFYLDVIKYITTNKIDIFKNYEKQIIEISKNNNNFYDIIEIIIETQENVKYNVNANLLIDRFILKRMEVCNE